MEPVKMYKEKKEEKPATEVTTPAASPADSAPQTGQDRSSEPTTSTTTETKAEEPIEDNYFRIHVKKLPEENKDAQGLWTWDDVEKPLKTGLTEPCPSRMPKKMTMATT